MLEEIEKVGEIAKKLRFSFDKVLVGQEKVKDVLTASLLCDKNSNILLQGNVGAGKTTLANALRNTFPLSERISVTYDLLPSDIQNQLKGKKEMRILEVDELNRMKGTSQATFLEIMAEHQMTFEGKKYPFSDFNVVATQNPKDTGTFTIPLAMYDRFDVCIDYEKLTREEKRTILFRGFKPAEKLDITEEELAFTAQAVSRFNFNEEDERILMEVVDYLDAMQFNKESLFMGDNIRAHMFLLKLAKLVAMSNGKSYILPKYIVDYIPYIYKHRINTDLDGMNEKEIANQFDEVKGEISKIKRKQEGFLR